MRRAALLTTALCAAFAGSAHAQARPNYPNVESQYMCVTCNIPLPEAESPQAARERAYLHHLIDSGRDEAQIRRAMIAVYGDKVLALPPRSGFNLVAYVVPVLAVLALVAALLFVLPRWRRRSAAGAPGDSAAALPEADSARLNTDMARFDL
jgi:cytochrome c-type biogenesis protein CcmH